LRFRTASRCRSCTRLELRRYRTCVTRTGHVAHVAPLSGDLRAALDHRSSFTWKPHCSCVPHLAGPWPESTGVPLVNLCRAPLMPATHLRWVSELFATTVRFMSMSTSCCVDATAGEQIPVKALPYSVSLMAGPRWLLVPARQWLTRVSLFFFFKKCWVNFGKSYKIVEKSEKYKCGPFGILVSRSMH
jgi:hypothetical protein